MPYINDSIHYQPKQNRRIPKSLQNLEGDGDIWLERCVYDDRGRKRSFFQSVKYDRCVWDEPPSGAANLVLADDVEKLPHFQKYRSAPPPSEALA